MSSKKQTYLAVMNTGIEFDSFKTKMIADLDALRLGRQINRSTIKFMKLTGIMIVKCTVAVADILSTYSEVLSIEPEDETLAIEEPRLTEVHPRMPRVITPAEQRIKEDAARWFKSRPHVVQPTPQLLEALAMQAAAAMLANDYEAAGKVFTDNTADGMIKPRAIESKLTPILKGVPARKQIRLSDDNRVPTDEETAQGFMMINQTLEIIRVDASGTEVESLYAITYQRKVVCTQELDS